LNEDVYTESHPVILVSNRHRLVIVVECKLIYSQVYIDAGSLSINLLARNKYLPNKVAGKELQGLRAAENILGAGRLLTIRLRQQPNLEINCWSIPPTLTRSTAQIHLHLPMSVMQEINAEPSNCLNYSSFRPASTLHACLMRHSSSDIRRPLSGPYPLQHLLWSRPSLVTKGSRTTAALHR
jgi:hypothetical protein